MVEGHQGVMAQGLRDGSFGFLENLTCLRFLEGLGFGVWGISEFETENFPEFVKALVYQFGGLKASGFLRPQGSEKHEPEL